MIRILLYTSKVSRFNHFLRAFVPFLLDYSFLGPTVLFFTVGFPKKAYNRGWVPPFPAEVIFFIPLSTLCSEKPFSSIKNFFSASWSIFFSHFRSTSVRTLGSLKRFLTSLMQKSSYFGILYFSFYSFSALQKSSTF